MQLEPYVFFHGRCEEALEFYKRAFGGEYELSRVGESPMASQFPPEDAQRVMHATFKGPGFTFMASDGRGTREIDPDAGNISLSLSADAQEGDRIFAALSEGGRVTLPLSAAMWGGRFGMLADRFGIEWMISTP